MDVVDRDLSHCDLNEDPLVPNFTERNVDGIEIGINLIPEFVRCLKSSDIKKYRLVSIYFFIMINFCDLYI